MELRYITDTAHSAVVAQMEAKIEMLQRRWAENNLMVKSYQDKHQKTFIALEEIGLLLNPDGTVTPMKRSV